MSATTDAYDRPPGGGPSDDNGAKLAKDSGAGFVKVVTVLVALAGLWFLLGVRLAGWAAGEPLRWTSWATTAPPAAEVGELAGGISARHTREIVWEQAGAAPDRWLLALLPSAVAVLCLIAGCWAVWQLVGRVAAGEPFGGRSAGLVYVVAIAVFGYGVVVPAVNLVVTFALALGTSTDSAGGFSVGMEYGIGDFWAIPISALLFLLAEVWRYGGRLRRDVEGLV